MPFPTTDEEAKRQLEIRQEMERLGLDPDYNLDLTGMLGLNESRPTEKAFSLTPGNITTWGIPGIQSHLGLESGSAATWGVPGLRVKSPEEEAAAAPASAPAAAPASAPTGQPLVPNSPTLAAKNAMQGPFPPALGEEPGSSSGPRLDNYVADEKPATPKAPIRAIRLPNGTIVFTNVDEYGGEEFSPEQGAALVRENARTKAEATGRVDPMDQAMISLVRRAALPEGPGRMVAGKTPPLTGNVSMMPGTPPIQQKLELEQVAGARDIMQARKDLQIASESPKETSDRENRDLQLAMYVHGVSREEAAPIVAQMNREIAMISKPMRKNTQTGQMEPNPLFLKDEDERRKRIEDIRYNANRDLNQVQIGSLTSQGKAPPSSAFIQ